MAEPRTLPPPRRSCEECLAIRATVSPPRPRKLPKPALVLPPNPATVLRQLLPKLDGYRAGVLRRLAERAIADADVEAIARSIQDVHAEVARRHDQRIKLHATYPLLYPAPCQSSAAA